MDNFLAGNVPRTHMSTTVTLALIGLTIVVLALLAVASVKYVGEVLSGEDHAEREDAGRRGPGGVAP